MAKITDKQWDKALDHTQAMMKTATELPDGTGFFYAHGCKDMLRRFLGGERSKKLYNEMINLS